MDFEYELKKAKEKFGENSNVIILKKINIEEFKEYINKVSQEENIYGEDLKEKISKGHSGPYPHWERGEAKNQIYCCSGKKKTDQSQRQLIGSSRFSKWHQNQMP